MMALPSTAEVVVVGAGPAGLAAACTLLANGIDVVVIDAAPEPSTSSRAVVIHSRTLEVMDDLGISEAVLSEGMIMEEGLVRSGTSVLGRIVFKALRTKYPMAVTLAQADTERILKNRLEALGGRIHRGVSATRVSETANGVQVDVNVSNEKSTSILAQYAIAADGRRSSTREQLGIKTEGGDNSQSFILADVKLVSTGSLQPDCFQEFLSPEGLLLYLPLPRGIWRVVTTADTPRADLDAALFQRMTDERAGPGIKIGDVLWMSRFKVSHGLAEHYRKGKVFLAGDTAHWHPPTGGQVIQSNPCLREATLLTFFQGMNISIQDGCRLANILTDALRYDETSAADLDRYENERRPIAAGVVSLTNRLTVLNTLTNPALCALRNWVLWTLLKVLWINYGLAWSMAGLGHR
ncbi:uncharacterized protein LTR77_009475 [Saxophila tyrrhenica]|uniref:FAD-binding domain-containing protein n=1 Tax=Saxophila tyrrhenica TaxID=1690608 RepID=A0AAV9NXQ7_9PEZI|nr:hypothetical protein LTR77_009475 [Saxophila tyrrhenica]